MWVAVLICFAGLCFLLFWIGSYRVEVDRGVMKYSTLLGGTKSVELKDVERAQVEVGYSRFRDRLKPPVRLIIRTRDGRTFAMNLKVFRARDIKHLLSLLNAHQQD